MGLYRHRKATTLLMTFVSESGDKGTAKVFTVLILYLHGTCLKQEVSESGGFAKYMARITNSQLVFWNTSYLGQVQYCNNPLLQ